MVKQLRPSPIYIVFWGFAGLEKDKCEWWCQRRPSGEGKGRETMAGRRDAKEYTEKRGKEARGNKDKRRYNTVGNAGFLLRV